MTCSNLKTTETVAPCEISKCVKSVTGLASNSSSPTDTWILAFKPGVRYQPGEKQVEKGFMKWWISPSSVSSSSRYLPALEGLKYEISLYRDVIRPLVEHNVSPNFVQYLSSSQKCTLGNMSQLLKGGRTLLSDTKVNNNIRRAVEFMMTRQPRDGRVNRPSTTSDIEVVLPNAVSIPSIWKASYLITEAVRADTLTFGDWLKQNTNSPEFWGLLFQAVAAIYAMQCAQMTHNDLHNGNLWVEKLKKPRQVLYVYGGKCYSFLMKHIVKVFDFDRSYAKQVKANKLLSGSICNAFSQCNRLSGKADLYRLFCGIIKSIVSNNVNLAWSLENMISDHSQYTPKEIMELFAEEDYYCQSARKDSNGIPKALPIEVIEKLPSVEDLLGAIAVKAGYVKKSGSATRAEDVYVCDPSLFTIGGKYKIRAERVVGC
jgi:hypothetical protein